MTRRHCSPFTVVSLFETSMVVAINMITHPRPRELRTPLESRALGTRLLCLYCSPLLWILNMTRYGILQILETPLFETDCAAHDGSQQWRWESYLDEPPMTAHNSEGERDTWTRADVSYSEGERVTWTSRPWRLTTVKVREIPGRDRMCHTVKVREIPGRDRMCHTVKVREIPGRAAHDGLQQWRWERYLDESGCVLFQTFNSIVTSSTLKGTSRFLRCINELQTVTWVTQQSRVKSKVVERNNKQTNSCCDSYSKIM